MATSLLSSLSASAAELVHPSSGSLPKSSFLAPNNLLLLTNPSKHRTKVPRICCYKPPAKSLDHIPKKFREENLPDGLMENYKTVPPSLYGLSPKQMDMFTTQDNPFSRQAEHVTEESLSSSKAYMGLGGMSGGSTLECAASLSMSVRMYRGGGGGGVQRRGSAPPDLPSLLLDARIVYLGMPIVPSVTELILAQFMYLDFEDTSKPIYLYINSPGTQDYDRQLVGSETDAYAIADMMTFCKSTVYTINLSMAYGQAAMLLSLGAKGFRAGLPYSSIKLHMPAVTKSSGDVLDMWIKAKDLEAMSDYYIELLEQGTGKPKEELTKDLLRTKFFGVEEAIEYGLVDKVITSLDSAHDRKEYDIRKLGAATAPGAFPTR